MTIGRRDLFRLPLRGVLPEPETRPSRPAIGADPGELPRVPGAPRPRMTVLAYGPHELTELPVDQLELLRTMRGRWPVMWVNVDALPQEMILRDLDEIFELHRLALEDLGDREHPAKAEAYGDELLFLIAHLPRLEPALELERIAIFLGPDYVLSFQERPDDAFEPVRERIRASRGRIRSRGPDYLAYALLDVVVDHGFPVTEAYANRLDRLEAEVARLPSSDTMGRLHQVRRELLVLRGALAPLREALDRLLREPAPLLQPDTLVHLRDTRDHAGQLLERVDTDGALVGSLAELHLMSVRERTHAGMRTLTLVAGTFLLLGFLVSLLSIGVEPPGTLWWRLPSLLGLMGVAVLGLAVWLSGRGWRRGE